MKVHCAESHGDDSLVLTNGHLTSILGELTVMGAVFSQESVKNFVVQRRKIGGQGPWDGAEEVHHALKVLSFTCIKNGKTFLFQ